jgi:hypothetical protein
MFVALIIGANFVTNIIEKEIDPHGIHYTDEFRMLEYVYNIFFAAELAVNMYAHCCGVFWRCGWNIFDVFVVTVSLVSMANHLPHSFSMLRMMRAFRVFRLFKRVRSLKKIITALAHAVPGVINAFLLLTIVMCIYAILAVELFIDVGEDCHDVSATLGPSHRGGCFGEEYFGSFSKSLYSFFQVLTGESWSEAIARPVLWSHTDPWYALGSAVFFVSFVLVTAFVLTNVVVAVLLDKMVIGQTDDEDDDLSCEACKSLDKNPKDQNETQEEKKVTTQAPAQAVAVQGMAGRLVSLENQVRQLNKASAEIREDLRETRQELHQQLAAVLAAVNDLVLTRQSNLPL